MRDTSPQHGTTPDTPSNQQQLVREEQQAPVIAKERSAKVPLLSNAYRKWEDWRRPKVPQVLQLTAIECGAASLAMILSYYGRKTTVSEIRNRYGVGRDGLSALSIVKAARAHGMRVRAVSLQEADLRYAKLPAIIHWEFNHFMVVEHWTPDHVDVVDPASGRRTLTADEFNRGFTGVMIMMEPGEQFDQSGSPRILTLRSYLALFARRAPVVLCQIVLASLFLQAFGLILPLLSKVVIDEIIPFRLTNIMPVLGIGMLLLLAADFVLSLLRSLMLIYLENRIDTYTMPRFIEHMLFLPLRFFQQRSSGDIVARVASNNVIRDTISSQFISTILDGGLVIGYLVILLWQSWPFAAVALSIGVLEVLLLVGTNAFMLRLYKRELEATGKTQGYVTEMLTGMETIKASGAEQQAFQRWSNLFCDLLNVSMRRDTFVSINQTIISTLRGLAPVVLLWIGTLQVLNGSLQLGTMIALNTLALAFLSPLTSLVSSATKLQLVRSHLDRIADVLEADAEQDLHKVQAPPVLTGSVQLKDVSFQYDPNSPKVLSHINLDIQPGQRVALVGRTGSGKSSLGKLLLGLYLPTEGVISYDNIPLSSLDLQAVRNQFGVVMQDSAIFNGTIRQNIAFHNSDLNLDETIHAAHMAALNEDIEMMPMGYETYVAESGKALSGGQRQRLAIARALAHSPSILLLDEATSSLDVVTERKVEQNLASLSCTQIIIAHRLSTVRNADVILVLDQGKIVERGTHDELLAKGGYYATLIHNQLEQNMLAVKGSLEDDDEGDEE